MMTETFDRTVETDPNNGHNTAAPGVQSDQYRPLSSVWEGSDAALIEEMLRFYPSIAPEPILHQDRDRGREVRFYPSIAPEPILNATYNRGRFWKNSLRVIVSMDIDPTCKPIIVGDNQEPRNTK